MTSNIPQCDRCGAPSPRGNVCETCQKNKGCPWCGSAPYFAHIENGLWDVGCGAVDDCLASTTFGFFATKAEAAAAWNHRSA